MRILAATVAVLVALAAAAAPAMADDLTDLKAARTASDAAFTAQDADKIRSMMTPDHVAVTTACGGPLTVDEQIASLPELKVTFSDVSEPQIVMFGADAAYISYEETHTGTYRGKPLADRVFASEIWVKADGKWLEKAYQETVIDSQ